MAATSLTSLSAYKAAVGITTQAYDAQITALIPQADQIIENYCKRVFKQTIYTEYYNGTNTPYLNLRQRPVANDVNLAVYVDPTGNGGQTAGGFAAGTLLTLGTDYMLLVDDQTLGSKKGVLMRLQGLQNFNFGLYNENYFAGNLSATKLPSWTQGFLNVKVVYNAGYATIPDDLVYAANMLISQMRAMIARGFALSSESLGAYSYSINNEPTLGEVRRVLSRYREISLG